MFMRFAPLIGHYRERQAHQILVAKFVSGGPVELIGHVPVGNERERLGPCQRGSLARGVLWRLAPSIQQVNAALVFTQSPQSLCVHVNAMGAAVDLRRPEFYEFQQALFQAALMDEGMQSRHGLHASRGLFLCIQASFQLSLLAVPDRRELLRLRAGEAGSQTFKVASSAQSCGGLGYGPIGEQRQACGDRDALYACFSKR
jgi:hypothetical protein